MESNIHAVKSKATYLSVSGKNTTYYVDQFNPKAGLSLRTLHKYSSNG